MKYKCINKCIELDIDNSQHCGTDDPSTAFHESCAHDGTCYTGQDPQWHLNDATTHLCNTCFKSYPNCSAGDDDVEFGCGKGNDNVVTCKSYFDEETL